MNINCNFELLMDPTTLAALASFPDQLAAHYAAFSAEFGNWAPASWAGVPSEPFTPIAQLCHVRDIEIDGYHLRIERTLREINPFLPAIDGEVLARQRAYALAEPAVVLAEFRAARAKTLDLIVDLSPAQFDRVATFEDYGPVTLRGLLHYLCSHDQQHVAGLQWLLGKIAATKARSMPTLRTAEQLSAQQRRLAPQQ